MTVSVSIASRPPTVRRPDVAVGPPAFGPLGPLALVDVIPSSAPEAPRLHPGLLTLPPRFSPALESWPCPHRAPRPVHPRLCISDPSSSDMSDSPPRGMGSSKSRGAPKPVYSPPGTGLPPHTSHMMLVYEAGVRRAVVRTGTRLGRRGSPSTTVIGRVDPGFETSVTSLKVGARAPSGGSKSIYGGSCCCLRRRRRCGGSYTCPSGTSSCPRVSKHRIHSTTIGERGVEDH